jgi:hypothetical protein
MQGANCLARTRKAVAMALAFPPISEFAVYKEDDEDWFEEVQERIREEKRRKGNDDEKEEDAEDKDEDAEEEEKNDKDVAADSKMEIEGEENSDSNSGHDDSSSDLSSSELARLEKEEEEFDDARETLWEARDEAFCFQQGEHGFLFDDIDSDLVPISRKKMYERAGEESDFVYNYENRKPNRYDLPTRKRLIRSVERSTGPFLHPLAVVSLLSSRMDRCQVTELALYQGVIPFLEVAISNLMELVRVLARGQGEAVVSKRTLATALLVQGRKYPLEGLDEFREFFYK